MGRRNSVYDSLIEAVRIGGDAEYVLRVVADEMHPVRALWTGVELKDNPRNAVGQAPNASLSFPKLFFHSLPLGDVGDSSVVIFHLSLFAPNDGAAEEAGKRPPASAPKLSLHPLERIPLLGRLSEPPSLFRGGVEGGRVDLEKFLSAVEPQHLGEGLIGIDEALLRGRPVNSFRDVFSNGIKLTFSLCKPLLDRESPPKGNALHEGHRGHARKQNRGTRVGSLRQKKPACRKKEPGS